MTVRVEHGDSRDVLKTLADASVDSVVTDPPYSLVSIQKRFGKPGSAPAQEGRDGLYRRASAGFMGKTWDTGETAFDPEFWREVYRVLKPGGHLIAFSGTRTYHRMTCAIEDAGFEIRDQIGWLYGSGFPKSHDVSKGIDKARGTKGKFGARKPNVHSRGDHQLHEGWRRPWMDDPEAVNNSGREYIPATDAAREWQGWGTALKPAWEPICLARKPLSGTVAETVLEHGTGALNIDGCRVETGDAWTPSTRGPSDSIGTFRTGSRTTEQHALGRWPANVIHDGSEEVLAAFPGEAGQQAPIRGTEASVPAKGDVVYGYRERVPFAGHGDSGSAARFFYSSKADGHDRLGSKHPTVKPIDLIAYLCRLVTPPNGLVLDPFAGSGTTGAACMREGFDCILIEREAEYITDIMARIELASADGRHPAAIKHRNVDPAKARGEDLPMFAAPHSVDAA